MQNVQKKVIILLVIISVIAIYIAVTNIPKQLLLPKKVGWPPTFKEHYENIKALIEKEVDFETFTTTGIVDEDEPNKLVLNESQINKLKNDLFNYKNSLLKQKYLSDDDNAAIQLIEIYLRIIDFSQDVRDFAQKTYELGNSTRKMQNLYELCKKYNRTNEETVWWLAEKMMDLSEEEFQIEKDAAEIGKNFAYLDGIENVYIDLQLADDFDTINTLLQIGGMLNVVCPAVE